MSTEELNRFVEQSRAAVENVGRQVEAFLDAALPDRVRLREEMARLGYQGRRSGWYPHRPTRRRHRPT